MKREDLFTHGGAEGVRKEEREGLHCWLLIAPLLIERASSRASFCFMLWLQQERSHIVGSCVARFASCVLAVSMSRPNGKLYYTVFFHFAVVDAFQVNDAFLAFVSFSMQRRSFCCF